MWGWGLHDDSHRARDRGHWTGWQCCLGSVCLRGVNRREKGRMGYAKLFEENPNAAVPSTGSGKV